MPRKSFAHRTPLVFVGIMVAGLLVYLGVLIGVQSAPLAVWLTLAIGTLACFSIAVTLGIRSMRQKSDSYSVEQVHKGLIGVILLESGIVILIPMSCGGFPPLTDIFITLSPVGVQVGIQSYLNVGSLIPLFVLCILAIILQLFLTKKTRSLLQEEVPKTLETRKVDALIMRYGRWTLVPVLLPLIASLGLITSFITITAISWMVFLLVPLLVYSWRFRIQSQEKFQQTCNAMRPREHLVEKDLEQNLLHWGKAGFSRTKKTATIRTAIPTMREVLPLGHFPKGEVTPIPVIILAFVALFGGYVVVLAINPLYTFLISIGNNLNFAFTSCGWLFVIVYGASITLTAYYSAKKILRLKGIDARGAIRFISLGMIFAEIVILVAFPYSISFNTSLIFSPWFLASPTEVQLTLGHPSYGWGAWLMFPGVLITFLSIILEIRAMKYSEGLLAGSILKDLEVGLMRSLISQVHRRDLLPLIIMMVSAIMILIPMTTVYAFPVVFLFLAPLWLFQWWITTKGEELFEKECAAMQPATQATSQLAAQLGQEYDSWTGKKRQAAGEIQCTLCNVKSISMTELFAHVKSAHVQTKNRRISAYALVNLCVVAFCVWNVLGGPSVVAIYGTSSDTAFDTFLMFYLTFLIPAITISWFLGKRQKGFSGLVQVRQNTLGVIVAQIAAFLMLPIFIDGATVVFSDLSLSGNLAYLLVMVAEYGLQDQYATRLLVLLLVGALILGIEVRVQKRSRNNLASVVTIGFNINEVDEIAGSTFRWTLMPLVLLTLLGGFFVWWASYFFLGISYTSLGSNMVLSRILFFIPLWIYHAMLCFRGRTLFKQACEELLPAPEVANGFISEMDQQSQSWTVSGKKKQN